MEGGEGEDEEQGRDGSVLAARVRAARPASFSPGSYGDFYCDTNYILITTYGNTDETTPSLGESLGWPNHKEDH